MSEGSKPPTPLPKTIGRYQIQGSLGMGAMGAVYKGFDPLIKRTLAIKTIRLDIPRQSEEYKTFLERFYQEARISGTLSHPNIVTLFDIGEDQGLPFLALEFVEGETVESLLHRKVKFRPEKVIGLVSQMAAALDYAHSKGIIHRDIKPANLMLYEEDRIKVTDFGIAKLADSEMTKAGQLLGTPSYMSPEQAMGEKLDGRSDIFSLGVVAFEMLAGEQPFPGANVTAILYKLVHMDPIEPANLEMNGLIPHKWHEVFGKCLAKKREERYQSAAEFVRDLEYCLGSWFTGIEALDTALAPSAAAPAGPGDPSIVVSMDEVTAAIAAPEIPPSPPQRPAQPAVPAEDDLPPTLPVSAGRPAQAAPLAEEDDLPPTLAVQRPAMAAVPEEEEPPPTVAVPRPAPVQQEKTVVLPPPKAAANKPASIPPFKPTGAPVRPLPPRAASASRPPAPRSVPPQAHAPQSVVPAAPARKGAPIGILIGGGAALLLLGIVAAYLLTSGGSATGGAVEATGRGVIHVESQPAGATIVLNGRPRGKTPAAVEGLAAGRYEVVAELAGYEPAFKKLALQEDRPEKVSLSLQASKDVMGEADILSRPAGATVYIDAEEKPAGRTPLRGQKLRVGNRRIRILTEGYEPYSDFLVVEEGKTARINPQLVKEGTSGPAGSPPSS
jgi:serine/threonine-protein kinase